MSRTGGTTPPAASASPALRFTGTPSPRAASAYARPAIATNSPATGLEIALSTASSGASSGRSRCSASAAAIPNAVPSANGSRFVASRVAEPTPNQSVPKRAARAPKWRRASSVKQAVAATAESAPISCGPSSQPSGGESSE